METEEIDFGSSLIESLGTDEYNTPDQVKEALKVIKEIEPKDAKLTVDAVYSIINSGYEQDSAKEKDIALLTNSILRKTLKNFPQNEECASKVLKLCKSISLSEPNLAEDAIGSIMTVFRKFSYSEKVQRECMSALVSLNGYRGTFDDSTKSVIDEKKKMMENHIKAQEAILKRGMSDKATWKKPNPQQTQVNERGNSNSDSRQDDISSAKGKSAADNIIGKTGRNWQAEREKSFNERLDKIAREIENGTYATGYGKNINNDYGYGR
ncbi:MAG: hypothetical protein IJS88_05990 [Alphaproteobacteria bacterium]|nr:hypothetical protein [Alphaproteobacteria bacterium]